MDITLTDSQLLSLLQLASSTLPVGAYSYSEGLETLVENDTVNGGNLKHWLEQSLRYGSIRIEAAVMVRSYRATKAEDLQMLLYWNNWLSATRETEELRMQSWQMGRSLVRLLNQLQPQTKTMTAAVGNPCNYAVAFGIAAADSKINLEATLLAYLQSWVSNLIAAGVKLIPLGQTAGQLLLLELQITLRETAIALMQLQDDELSCCSWGSSLACMNHETQYTRLFRS